MNPTTKKTLRWAAGTLAVLVVLFAIFLAVERVRGRSALNKYLAQMRAKGEKFTIAELTPAPVPPELNGAGMLMAAMFRANGMVPQQIPTAMRFATSGVAVPAAKVHAWSSGVQLDVLLATNFPGDTPATNTATKLRRPSGGRPALRTILTAADLAAEIALHSNALAQAQAALLLGPIDHGLQYSNGFNGYTVVLPQFMRERTLINWLRAASLSALHQTNLDVSLTNLLALAALSHAASSEPLMVIQMMRIAMHQVGVSAMWEALQMDGWTEEQLRALQAAMEPSDFVSSLSQAYEMERAMGLSTIDHAIEDPKMVMELMGSDASMYGTSGGSDELEELAKKLRGAFLSTIYLPIWNVAWKDYDKLNLLQQWQRDIDVGQRQERKPNWKANSPLLGTNQSGQFEFYFSSEEQAQSITLLTRLRCPISSRLGGHGAGALNAAVKAEATRELVVTAIALRRFQLARGSYPAALDELVPKYLAVKPIDPFDGQPLRYRSNADGTFLLYSVGPDGKDDGGNAAPSVSSNKPGFVTGRDIVWPRAATAQELEKVIEEDSRSRR